MKVEIISAIFFSTCLLSAGAGFATRNTWERKLGGCKDAKVELTNGSRLWWESRKINKDIPDLRMMDFDDQASRVWVCQTNLEVLLYSDTNFQGEVTVVRSDTVLPYTNTSSIKIRPILE
jgi:hypothetical protein